MADAAIVNAKARLDTIRARIEAIQGELSALKQEQDAVEKFISAWNVFAGIESPPAEKPSTPGNPPRNLVGDHAEAIIRKAGRPVSREKLFLELKARGINIYGKNPEMVLSTMVWRMKDRFVRLPGFGYWLADRPFEPAQYKPADLLDHGQRGVAETDEGVPEEDI